MSYIPTAQNDVDFIVFVLQQLKLLRLNQAHFPVLNVKDRMSSNCTFERPEIEIGESRCTYPGDLIYNIRSGSMEH